MVTKNLGGSAPQPPGGKIRVGVLTGGASAERARPGDLVLVLGAGDIRPAGMRLLELLRERATV